MVWTVMDLTRLFLKLECMDLTISIQEYRITNTLFEKQLNLYLYIPPHAAHPQGVNNGIICGQIHLITNLCNEKDDHKSLIRKFCRRLIKRGYNRQNILPMFEKSILHSKKKALTSVPSPPQKLYDQIKTQQLFFHVIYHPDNVNSFELQRKF